MAYTEPMKIHDKTFVMTGASGGIGGELVLGLLAKAEYSE